jgi:hypothetical protein
MTLMTWKCEHANIGGLVIINNTTALQYYNNNNILTQQYNNSNTYTQQYYHTYRELLHNMIYINLNRIEDKVMIR